VGNVFTIRFERFIVFHTSTSGGGHDLPYSWKNGETKLICPSARRVKNHGFRTKAKNALALSFSSHPEFAPSPSFPFNTGPTSVR
jgi:hypothetical protein